jgi:hypothetical protein
MHLLLLAVFPQIFTTPNKKIGTMTFPSFIGLLRVMYYYGSQIKQYAVVWYLLKFT